MRITIDPTAVTEYYDEWSFCDGEGSIRIGNGWQHLGGTDFQYTPDDEFTSSLTFGGIIPNRDYLITGQIELMDAIAGRSSIRIKLGTLTDNIHSITTEASGTPLIIVGTSSDETALFELEAWTNLTISKFIIRDLTIKLVPEGVDLTAIVDGNNFLLDTANALLIDAT